jgi:hypothetical protein
MLSLLPVIHQYITGGVKANAIAKLDRMIRSLKDRVFLSQHPKSLLLVLLEYGHVLKS